ncbi:MAG TPA: hypothetical protein VIQ00_10055 [Chitinophagaceae bacterium]
MSSITNEIIKRRMGIAEDYAKRKGWIVGPLSNCLMQLSFEQILEIREQKNWKDVTNDIPNGIKTEKKEK